MTALQDPPVLLGCGCALMINRYNEVGPGERCERSSRGLNPLLGVDERGLAVKATRTCSVEGCDGRAKTRGWCSAHYERWRLTGSVGTAPIKRLHPDRDGCSVEGCDRPYCAVGFCSLHWRRNNAYGDPHYITPLGFREQANAWKEDVGYHAVHHRLKRYRGSAGAHQCVRCGGDAHEWAYDHSDPDEQTGDGGGYLLVYSVDIDRYQPMCRVCHSRFDRERR